MADETVPTPHRVVAHLTTLGTQDEVFDSLERVAEYATKEGFVVEWTIISAIDPADVVPGTPLADAIEENAASA